MTKMEMAVPSWVLAAVLTLSLGQASLVFWRLYDFRLVYAEQMTSLVHEVKANTKGYDRLTALTTPLILPGAAEAIKQQADRIDAIRVRHDNDVDLVRKERRQELLDLENRIVRRIEQLIVENGG